MFCARCLVNRSIFNGHGYRHGWSASIFAVFRAASDLHVVHRGVVLITAIALKSFNMDTEAADSVVHRTEDGSRPLSPLPRVVSLDRSSPVSSAVHPHRVGGGVVVPASDTAAALIRLIFDGKAGEWRTPPQSAQSSLQRAGLSASHS